MSDLLVLDGVHASYGRGRVLHGVSLAVPAGSVVTLLGRNGAGKTTTIRTICGLLRATSGRITLDGADITGLRPDEIARLGVACVPEERNVFSHLTVLENLRIAARKRSPWSVEQVLDTFPIIRPLLRRRGGTLSGGEQQIVAIARALLLGPRVLLLDEPSQGLAPVMVDHVLEVLRKLKATGLAMLLVEQKLDLALELAEHAYLLDSGRLVHSTPAAALAEDTETVHRYLGVGS